MVHAGDYLRVTRTPLRAALAFQLRLFCGILLTVVSTGVVLHMNALLTCRLLYFSSSAVQGIADDRQMRELR